ncbi:hypothetical protein Tco_0191304 [Tanacetum coccineum]
MLTIRNPIKLGDPMQQLFHRLLLLSCQVVQIVLWYLDSGCSKHMTGNHSQLINFLGNIVISRVYYVEGLGHNLFSVGQFCDEDLEVAFRKTLALLGI